MERLAHLDDLVAEFVARIVNMRPTLWVTAGPGHRALVKYDPPTPEAHSPQCKSCKSTLQGNERGRLLCTVCRSKSALVQGDPLIHTMYRHSHPMYVLDQATEAVVVHISVMRKIAKQDLAMAQLLSYWRYQVFERWRAGHGDRNICLTREMDPSNEPYTRSITCCNPIYVEGGHGPALAHSPRHLAVTVGGLGPELYGVVRQAVLEWLYNLDAMVRRRFAVPLEQEYSDTSIGTVFGRFARLIADRVVRLEVRGENPTKYMCALAFQHVIECENVRCKHHAEALAGSDIRCMRMLKQLVDEGVSTRLAVEQRERLASFLNKPCPELLKALPEVAQQYAFQELADALVKPAYVPAEVEEWRATVQRGALTYLIDRAIEKVQEWRPPDFLQCVRFDDPPRPGPFLPPMGWEDNPLVSSWTLVSSATHCHRRTGLDPAGLRIVLMSSALLSISADERFFRAGLIQYDLRGLEAVLKKHESIAEHNVKALSNQLKPYMTGEPWKAARTDMIEWQGSHLEDEVRRAGALLGGFSVQEIVERYGQCDGSPAARATQSALHTALVRSTSDKMIFKPAPHYEDWFPLALDLALPILAQLRRSMGLSNLVATNPIGDVLRLIPRVRDWKPGDGVLQLKAGEAYRVPKVKTVLEELKAAGSPLVVYRRPREGGAKKGYYWIFDPSELAKVLGT